MCVFGEIISLNNNTTKLSGGISIPVFHVTVYYRRIILGTEHLYIHVPPSTLQSSVTLQRKVKPITASNQATWWRYAILSEADIGS